ncbi:hypothetical protein M426DRAFT_319751 [Hypoxylon sp. CI-4A]|nr:hypothetical protein M426DRAFT_319751 [Hypoxylon sp. CI-4A]
MLEKTAASLEPCGFQRVVPGATQSFRKTRQLRNAFWKHGATDIELTTAWQSLMHGTFDLNMGPTSEEDRGSSLSASAFLLDFLYPSGAMTLMRRLTPNTTTSATRPDNIRYGQHFTKLAPRPYTSSIPKRQAKRTGSEFATTQEVHKSTGGNSASEQPATYLEGTGVTKIGRTPDGATSGIASGVHNAVHKPRVQFFDIPEDEDSLKANSGHMEALKDLLVKSNQDPEVADNVWHHYKSLNEPSQATYLHQVLLFLSRTGRLSDSWKISELFRKLPPSRWTNHVFVAGVAAEINLQNHSEAVRIFVRGLKRNALEVPFLVDALDLILSDALRSSKPDLLSAIWRYYPRMTARLDFDGITSQLKEVSSVPGLSYKALDFGTYDRHVLQDFRGAKLSQEALDALQKILVRRALLSCLSSEVIPLLNVTRDPLAFEEFLRTASKKGKQQLGIELYRIYRDLPGGVPSHPVLHELFKVYKGLNVPISTKYAGLELLWGDWHKFHTNPSYRAFQKYLAFYASQGDTDRVYTLWIRFVELYRDDPDIPVLAADDLFSHLLQVHAVRGERSEALRIFKDISGKFGIKPNTHSWNILLNAFAKAGDYQGAITTFEELVVEGTPDKYSYGTMMQMAGERGDLGFTIELYRQALSNGVRANDAMLSSLVDAYCQNDHMQAAEDICVRAAKRGIVTTRMWNKVIQYHAFRRDLAAINKVLGLMAEKNIPYNHYTYQQLLLGLSFCGQSQHAINLLAVALKEKIFEVTVEHFYIVMTALLRTREPGAVLRVHEMMVEHGFPSSSESVFRLIQALGQWKNLSPEQRAQTTATEWLGRALRSFSEIYGLDDQKKPASSSTSTPSDSPPTELLGKGTERFHFSAVTHMLIELKDFVQAQELVDLYRHIFQGSSDPNSVLPAAMLNAIMRAEFEEKRYDRVRATWEILFENAKKTTQSVDSIDGAPQHTKISPRYRYILSSGFSVMQKMLFEEGDAAGMKDLVRDIRSAGFDLNSKNWNSYIQALVQLKEYKEAFITCEKLLMPNWTGWFVVRQKENIKNHLPIDLRRKGKSPRHLRPTATTLYHLAHGWMELGRASTISADAARIDEAIGKECVRVIRAIKSMNRVHSRLEEEIFGQEERAIADSVDFLYDDQDYQTKDTWEAGATS